MYSVCHSKSNVSNQNACDFMIIIGANFFIIKSEVQTFIGLIGCSNIFFSDVKKLISKLYLH